MYPFAQYYSRCVNHRAQRFLTSCYQNVERIEMVLFVKEQFNTTKLSGNQKVFSRWSLCLLLNSVSLFFLLCLCSFKSLFNIYFSTTLSRDDPL